METKIKPIPRGYHSITPGLVIKDGARAIDFYKKAFGAKENYRVENPDGGIMHAELRIGNSNFMLGSEPAQHPGHEESCARAPSELNGTTVSLYLYVENADAVFEQAVQAGAQATGKMEDMFWGDRVGQLKDPFGYLWTVATHTADVTPEEMKARAKEYFAKAGAH